MNELSQFRDTARKQISGDGSSLRGANLSSAAQHNRKIILHAIRARGEVTCGELAVLIGLSPPAVFKIVRKLCEEGWVTRSRVNEKARGQPTHTLRLNPDAAFSLGLNIDRDHLTLVAVDFAGKVRRRFHVSTSFAGPADVRSFVANCVRQLRSDTFAPASRIAGLGAAVPDDLGSMSLQGQSSWDVEWQHKGLAGLLGGIVDAHVVQENDGAAAAIGEMLFGAGLEFSSFFYLLIGGGLSSGLVVNNQYVRGAHGRGAEIGLLPQIGTQRTNASDLQETLGDGLLLSNLLNDLNDLGYESVTLESLDHLDAAGQAVVEQWIDRVAEILYFPLLAVICTVDPNAIIIGGPLPSSITQRLCFKIRKRFSTNVGIHWQEMIVKPARVVLDPAAVGAAVLAFQEMWAPDVQWTACLPGPNPNAYSRNPARG